MFFICILNQVRQTHEGRELLATQWGNLLEVRKSTFNLNKKKRREEGDRKKDKGQNKQIVPCVCQLDAFTTFSVVYEQSH